MPVRWPPDSPRRTKARLKWLKRFRRLKPGHSLKDLARRWGETYGVVRRWAKLFVYDKAGYCRGFPDEMWERADWDQSLTEIARQLGVSQPTVTRRREVLGMEPLKRVGKRSNGEVFQLFRKWLRKHRRLLDGLPASQILRLAGLEKDIHPFSAGRPIRDAASSPTSPTRSGGTWTTAFRRRSSPAPAEGRPAPLARRPRQLPRPCVQGHPRPREAKGRPALRPGATSRPPSRGTPAGLVGGRVDATRRTSTARSNGGPVPHRVVHTPRPTSRPHTRTRGRQARRSFP
jgi:hypothetical protein